MFLFYRLVYLRVSLREYLLPSAPNPCFLAVRISMSINLSIDLLLSLNFLYQPVYHSPCVDLFFFLLISLFTVDRLLIDLCHNISNFFEIPLERVRQTGARCLYIITRKQSRKIKLSRLKIIY